MGNTDSKAEFRGLVQALIENGVPSDSDLWNTFWRLPSCDRDVFTFIQPGDVRMLLDSGVDGVKLLLRKALEKLKLAIEMEALDEETILETMNAVRVLTRVLPFVLEQGSEPDIEAMFWHLDGEVVKNSLGRELIDCVGRLLFLPGLTLPADMEKPIPTSSLVKTSAIVPSSRRKSATAASEDDDTDYDSRLEDDQRGFANLNHSVIWSPGIGTLSAAPDEIYEIPSPTRDFNKKRYEILKLLLVCQSEILFYAPKDCKPELNKWIQATVIHDLDSGMPFCREILCSLLNQVLTYDPVGWGLPYGSTLQSGVDEELFTDICLHNLLVFLEVNSWANVFRRLLGDISCPQEFAFMYDNIARLLNVVPEAAKTYLPGSKKSFDSFQELLILLWKLLDSNKEFMGYVLKSCDVTRIIQPIVYFMWDGRKNMSKVGLIHICTFVILLLSGERNFGVALNKPYHHNLPLAKAPKMTNCNHGDLIVILFYKLIFDGSKRLSTLYTCFLTVLSNISPYIKSFGQLASMRLLSLFERFSSATFLFAKENNHQYMLFLLDIFNNVIQYQYEGNFQLVYTLCNQEKVVRKLAELEFTPPVIEEEGQKKFVPTEEWFNSWKTKLPINAIVRMLDILVPQIEQLNTQSEGTLQEGTILDFLHESTMVGLLPVPHPIVIRRYQPNQHTTLWFTTYSLGVIFLKHQNMPIWDGNKIKLFQINVIDS